MLVEHRLADQVGVVGGAGDEGAVEPVPDHMLDQRPGRPGGQADLGPRKRLVEALEHGGQAHRRCGLQGAEAEQAVGAIAHRLMGGVGQPQHLPRVVQQHLARRGQHHALGGAVEQDRVQLGLEVLQPGGDVRLHGVEPAGGARHPAGLGNGDEDRQIAQAHHNF